MLCIFGFVVALLLFLLLPSSLSSSPLGVIVATNTAVVLVLAPAVVALAAFVVALAVIATTFLAVEVALVVDCCVFLASSSLC